MPQPFSPELQGRKAWNEWCKRLNTVQGVVTYSLLNRLNPGEPVEKYAWKHNYEVDFFYKQDDLELKVS